MIDNYSSRIIKEAYYILENGCTVREAAKEFGISKSTLHADIAYKLKKIDGNLYREVKKLMDYHFSVRHIRGGEATKKKYTQLKS